MEVGGAEGDLRRGTARLPPTAPVRHSASVRPLIDAELANWIVRGGPTITVASRDEQNRPSLGQAIGCKLDDERRRLTLFLLEARNQSVIADFRRVGAAAVVFTNSFSTRSLQLKTSEVREVAFSPADHERVTAYIGAVALEFANHGVPDGYVRALLVREPGPILAFELTPEIAFDQTPGPRAGSPVEEGS